MTDDCSEIMKVQVRIKLFLSLVLLYLSSIATQQIFPKPSVSEQQTLGHPASFWNGPLATSAVTWHLPGWSCGGNTQLSPPEFPLGCSLPAVSSLRCREINGAVTSASSITWSEVTPISSASFWGLHAVTTGSRVTWDLFRGWHHNFLCSFFSVK